MRCECHILRCARVQRPLHNEFVDNEFVRMGPMGLLRCVVSSLRRRDSLKTLKNMSQQHMRARDIQCEIRGRQIVRRDSFLSPGCVHATELIISSLTCLHRYTYAHRRMHVSCVRTMPLSESRSLGVGCCPSLSQTVVRRCSANSAPSWVGVLVLQIVRICISLQLLADIFVLLPIKDPIDRHVKHQNKWVYVSF